MNELFDEGDCKTGDWYCACGDVSNLQKAITQGDCNPQKSSCEISDLTGKSVVEGLLPFSIHSLPRKHAHMIPQS